MTRAKQMHRTAQHMRELARDSCLPDYIEKMVRTADDLETHANDLECPAPAN